MEVGDKVSFLNDVGGGTIIRVLTDKKVAIENEDGFEEEHWIKNLVIKSASKDYKLDGIEYNLSVQEKIKPASKQKQLDDFQQKTKGLNRIETQDEIEVDLHIEELIETSRGMGNAQILAVQMANFKRELNVAIRKKVRKLIVIHGVGEGVLKAEIKHHLYDFYPSMEHHDASYRKYGYGATEILIYTR